MKVFICKPDLDTCLCGLLLGVNSDDDIRNASGNAPARELVHPEALCIECGGSGQVQQNNFDHHDTEDGFPPACKQAFDLLGCNDSKTQRLVSYVCKVDLSSPCDRLIPFPSLSNIFSGMLFVEKSPLSRFLKGMDILMKVLTEGIDPFSTIPIMDDMKEYITAKEKNRIKLAGDLRDIKYFRSGKGLKIGYLKSEGIGGISTLFSHGCDIAVLFNPAYGDQAVPKFTIAGNGVCVIQMKSVFERVEKGWGGHRLIIGSPRTGTTIPVTILIEKLILYL